MAMGQLLDEPDLGAGPRRPTDPPPTPTPTSAPDVRSGIASAYQKFLGRAPSESDYTSWVGNNNYAQGISASPEAQAYAKGQAYTRTYQPMAGWDQDKLNNAGHTTTKYNWGRAVQQHPDWLKAGSLNQMAQFYNQAYGGQARVTGSDTIDFGDGYGPVDVIQGSHSANPTPWWNPTGGGAASGTTNLPSGSPMTGQGQNLYGPTSGAQGDPRTVYGPGGQPGSNTGAPQVAGNPGVFSDPATTEWETILRHLVDTLNTPKPTLTDAQRELQQTQALDPMTRERDALKQRVIQQYAAKGQEFGHSGPVDQALADIDRQFEQLRTTTQANFAVNDINREDQNYGINTQNAQSAANFMRQIPQLADSRLAAAQGSLQNPLQLAQVLLQQQGQNNQQNAYNSAQQQQFWQQMASIIAGMFK